MSKARIKRVRLGNADLIFHSPFWRLFFAVLAGVVGILGFTISWIAIELAFPVLFTIPNALLIFVFVGAYSLVILAVFRNRILRRVAKRGFLFTLNFQRLIQWLFWVDLVLAVYAILARTGRIPEYSPVLSLFFMGIYFLLAMPRIVLGQLIRTLREARLCTLQFLLELEAGQTNYFWLREGLSTVERKFRKLGYSIPKGGVYLWACFSLRNSVRLESQLSFLSDWLRNPRKTNEIDAMCTTITLEARAADREKFKPPKGRFDIPSIILSTSLPRWWDKVATMFVIFLFGSVMLGLASESSTLPLPALYVQGASLGLLSIALTVVWVMIRRKPPAPALKLVSEIYPKILSTDDNYDAVHLSELTRLISEKQETIQSLTPILGVVAPKISEALTNLLLAIKDDLSANSGAPMGIETAMRLVAIPRTRLLISDLREDCEELLSKNAYDYPES